MIKSKTLIIFVVLAAIIITVAFVLSNSESNMDNIKKQLSEQRDSLSDLHQSYDSLSKRYVQIERGLIQSTDKLRYIQQKLDTITSHRIETFTEIQTRLIEIKLSLGNIPTYTSDSSNRFRFE